MEFNYMMLQAYDFYELSNRHKCFLQIGGSDQWGNIVNGVDLIKRKNQKIGYGLTTPLITLSSGAKMGKTEKGAIWLNKKMLTPYDYWQFWRNTNDKDVYRFLKMFTEINVEEINSFEKKKYDINKLKTLLANKTTEMLHGLKTSKDCEITADKTFKDKLFGKDLPTFIVKKNEIDDKINILDLVMFTNLANSKSEIRRMIKNNGLRINNETINNENKIFLKNDFNENNTIKVSHGKKQHAVIKFI
jgi:tyrosyl-tRNA synthetase